MNKYLQFLNDNYFKEVGYYRINSKLNDMKNDNKKYEDKMKILAIAYIGLALCFIYIWLTK